jgi:hypothetical protein
MINSTFRRDPFMAGYWAYKQGKKYTEYPNTVTVLRDIIAFQNGWLYAKANDKEKANA